MKLYYPTEADAQAVADLIHRNMIATSKAYADSVAAGQTLRWDVPVQEEDGTWGVTVNDRCESVLSPEQTAQLPKAE